MDTAAFVKATGLCVISMIIEMASATAEDKKWFEQLQQPKYSLPFSIWYVAGVVYYLGCGVIAYRQFINTETPFSPPVILLMTVMCTNGLSNFLLFKFRSVKFFYLALYPYTALFIALTAVLASRGNVVPFFVGVYLLWLIYDLYYFNCLAKLNRS